MAAFYRCRPLIGPGNAKEGEKREGRERGREGEGGAEGKKGRRIGRISPPAETDGRSLRVTNFEATKEEETEGLRNREDGFLEKLIISCVVVVVVILGKFFAAEWNAAASASKHPSVRKWPRERIHSRISAAFCSPKNKRASLRQPTNNLVSPVEEREGETRKKWRRGQNATLISPFPPSLSPSFSG